MPQFILNTDGAADTLGALDAFTLAYIEALFFTESEPGTVQDEADGAMVWNPETDSSLPGDVGLADMAPETLARIIADCAAFQAANAQLWADGDADDSQAGHDYWLTRQGSGTGFWDRDAGVYGEHADALDKAAKAAGEVWAYLGDDGQVYA